MAVSGLHPGDSASFSEIEPVSSGLTSPREYAVPRVDTTTSLAAKPPTKAILVRQSKPANLVILSRLVSIRPAIECLNATWASPESTAKSWLFSSAAAVRGLESVPILSVTHDPLL